MTTLHLLSAGAAQGLVQSVLAAFEREEACTVQCRFGAVGAMKEAMLAGAPCDLMILTQALVRSLAADGHLLGASEAPLGQVLTGIAVQAGRAHPDIRDEAALRRALLAADSLYFPDPERATAGIHFAGVLRRLGIADTLAERCRNFPNGATSMRELALARSERALGCTQASEILATPGVELVGALPDGFGLATLYCAALRSGTPQPGLATRLLQRLTGEESRGLRQQCGFLAI